MATCAKCGAETSEGALYCSVCGASLTSPGGSPPIDNGTSRLTSNLAAAISYLGGFVTGILFLVIEPYNRDPFVRFHAYQSILFCGSVLAFWLVWALLSKLLVLITFGLFALMVPVIGLLAFLGITVYWIFLMWKAFNQEKYLIPILGPAAERQAK